MMTFHKLGGPPVLGGGPVITERYYWMQSRERFCWCLLTVSTSVDGAEEGSLQIFPHCGSPLPLSNFFVPTLSLSVEARVHGWRCGGGVVQVLMWLEKERCVCHRGSFSTPAPSFT